MTILEVYRKNPDMFFCLSRLRSIALTLSFLSAFLLTLNAQIILKQQNTPGSELYADAPYRMIKSKTNNTLNDIPILLYIHDSNSGIYNNEIAYIDIKVKNASDSAFTHLLTYNYLNAASFNNLLANTSVEDSLFGIQDFWSGLPQKSTQHTIVFSKDINIWMPPVPYVDVVEPYFYFTFLVPGDNLIGYEDIVDFEITFGLDWAPDEYVYLRVHRSDLSFPKITDWYRGDVHYHGMFTQDAAENGLPLEATKDAAQLSGLDWITVTDHSCDFDNYGISMSDNWERLGQIITQLNGSDSSFIFIRGMELSVNNSDNKIVHSLMYPCETDPFSLPYFSDGGGDLSGTFLNINKMNDSLKKYNAFSYAAHPFAEKDALPFLVNGGIWNLNDSLLPVNGAPHPSSGTIISNNLSILSDIYSDNDSSLLKSNIVGTQIWNDARSLYTDANPYDPWNVTYQNASEFSAFTLSNPMHHIYRLNQNMDVYKAILQRGLIEKNANDSLNNWKCFLSGGSDAHGDLNFSNTNYFNGLNTDYITDNAIGKINTLAYCPNGMGSNGSNILKALRAGNTVISSGPVLLLNISESGQKIAFPGNDTLISDYNNCFVSLEIFTNPEFGAVYDVALIVGTQNGEERIELPYFQPAFTITITNLFNQLQNVSIANTEWFYIRAEMETKRLYSFNETQIFKKNQEYFYCFTNPIWLKSNLTTNLSKGNILNNNFRIYPNPADNAIQVDFLYNQTIKSIEIFTATGEIVFSSMIVNSPKKDLDISDLKSGVYFIRVTSEYQSYVRKFIKY